MPKILTKSSGALNKNAGTAPYRDIYVVGKPARDERESRDKSAFLQQCKDNRAARARDKRRQKKESDVNWDKVKVFLDLGKSLEHAKLLAKI